MKYSDLKSASEVALNKGLDLICKKTLPTFWSPDGCGWHEQWMNVDYSGVYAGCEGIILLSQTKRYLDGNEYDRLIKSTYENNLCLIFDSDLEIKHNDSFEYRLESEEEIGGNYKGNGRYFQWYPHSLAFVDLLHNAGYSVERIVSKDVTSSVLKNATIRTNKWFNYFCRVI